MESLNDLIKAIAAYYDSLDADGKADLMEKLDHSNVLNVFPFNLNDDLHIICVDDLESVMLAAMATQNLIKSHGVALFQFPDNRRYYTTFEEEQIPTMCGGNWDSATAMQTVATAPEQLSSWVYGLHGYVFRAHMPEEGILYKALRFESNFDAMTIAKYLTINAAILKGRLLSCVYHSSMDNTSMSIGVEGNNVHVLIHVDQHEDGEGGYERYDEENDEYYWDEDYTGDDEDVCEGWFENTSCLTLDELRAQPLGDGGAYAKLTYEELPDVELCTTEAVFPECVYNRGGRYDPVIVCAAQYYIGDIDDDPYHRIVGSPAILISSNLGDPGWSTLDVMRAAPAVSGYYRMSPEGYATNVNEGHHYIAAIVLLPHPTYVADISACKFSIKEVSSNVIEQEKAA